MKKVLEEMMLRLQQLLKDVEELMGQLEYIMQFQDEPYIMM
jgi:hypothetical protein